MRWAGGGFSNSTTGKPVQKHFFHSPNHFLNFFLHDERDFGTDFALESDTAPDDDEALSDCGIISGSLRKCGCMGCDGGVTDCDSSNRRWPMLEN